MLSSLYWQSAERGAARVDAVFRRVARHDAMQQASADSTTKPPSWTQFRLEVFLGREVAEMVRGGASYLALPSHTSLGVSVNAVVIKQGELGCMLSLCG